MRQPHRQFDANSVTVTHHTWQWHYLRQIGDAARILLAFVSQWPLVLYTDVYGKIQLALWGPDNTYTEQNIVFI